MGIIFGTFAPIIISTTGGTNFTGGTVTISASCAIGIINWYNSGETFLATGNTYSASAAGNYYCDVTYDGRTTPTKTSVNVAAPPPTKTIGDTYQGGVVFYITAPTAGATSGTAGLISKTTNMTGTGVWGCYGTAISGADGTAIGTGNQNTTDIHNAGCSHVPVAANYCYDLTDGTYSDWWLPSLDELNQMYIQKSVIGGFLSSNYWSSSEYSTYNAWRQNFNVGNKFNVTKYGSCYVRAFRGF